MRHPRHDRAFSLIEVLIAVLVLALGLLGLGAVFPVVIAQQRDAVDQTVGSTLIEGVRSRLDASDELINWSLLTENGAYSAESRDDGCNGMFTYLWEADWRWDSFDSLENFRATGEIELRAWPCSGPAFAPDLTPVTARLVPEPYSGRAPQYVWDFVGRREPLGDRVQIALFLRRIDPGIRVPRGSSLSDVLTGGNGISGAERRLAVGVDRDGRPTGAGAKINSQDSYAIPLSLLAEVPNDPDLLDRVTLSNDPDLNAVADFDTRWRLASRIGQKLVDNVGAVRTVVGVDEDTDNTVIVRPAFELGRAKGSRTLTTMDPRQAASIVQQVVFTPQVPVQVRVFEVSP